jgi:hypothetical protein
LTVSKYRSRITIVDGHKFASKAEARRYCELVTLQRAGLISDLKLQPKFPLMVNGQCLGHYIADFSYVQKCTPIIEDVKSPATSTAVYRLKRKLVKAIHGLDITEVL